MRVSTSSNVGNTSQTGGVNWLLKPVQEQMAPSTFPRKVTFHWDYVLITFLRPVGYISLPSFGLLSTSNATESSLKIVQQKSKFFSQSSQIREFGGCASSIDRVCQLLMSFQLIRICKKGGRRLPEYHMQIFQPICHVYKKFIHSCISINEGKLQILTTIYVSQ